MQTKFPCYLTVLLEICLYCTLRQYCRIIFSKSYYDRNIHVDVFHQISESLDSALGKLCPLFISELSNQLTAYICDISISTGSPSLPTRVLIGPISTFEAGCQKPLLNIPQGIVWPV